MSKLDRRVRYTKSIIKKSLLELMQTTPYDRITVKELCSKADINRATFYAHYESLAALMEEIEYEECKELFDLLDDILADEYNRVHSTPVMIRSTTIMLQFLKEHTTLREIFLCRTEVSKGLSKLTWEHLNKSLDRIADKDKITREEAYWIVLFIVQGMRECLRQWFKTDMTDEEAFIKTLCMFIQSGLNAFI